jgi:serine/threonine protein kinase
MVLRQVIAGLVHIHARGFIHGDLKPDNILLDAGCFDDRGGEGRGGSHGGNHGGTDTTIDADTTIVICDFGTSLCQAEAVHTNRVQTCLYRAPEIDFTVARSAYSAKIDMWSLGVIIYEMVAGCPLFHYDPRNPAADDASYYAAQLYGVDFDDRKQRLRVLRDIRYIAARRYIVSRIDAVRRNEIPDTFIELMTKCLMPNLTRRITAATADVILTPRIMITPPQDVPPDDPMGDMAGGMMDVTKDIARVPGPKQLADGGASKNGVTLGCLTGISRAITQSCPRPCLDLAESIFQSYMDRKDVAESTMVRMAAIYIALCLHNSDHRVRNELQNSVHEDSLVDAVIEIMITLDGYVL